MLGKIENIRVDQKNLIIKFGAHVSSTQVETLLLYDLKMMI
jgi:hypothetical protein